LTRNIQQAEGRPVGQSDHTRAAELTALIVAMLQNCTPTAVASGLVMSVAAIERG
jgi:hypothetical protein